MICVREILTSIVFRQILILRFFVQKFNGDLSATSYMKFRRCHVSLFTPVFLPLLPTPQPKDIPLTHRDKDRTQPGGKKVKKRTSTWKMSWGGERKKGEVWRKSYSALIDRRIRVENSTEFEAGENYTCTQVKFIGTSWSCLIKMYNVFFRPAIPYPALKWPSRSERQITTPYAASPLISGPIFLRTAARVLAVT